MAPIRYTIPAGSPTHYCRGCRAKVFWVQAGGVRRLKLNPDGSKHRCPRVLGRAVRPAPRRWGDFYVARASDRKYAIRIAGGRSLGVLNVSTHNSPREAQEEVRCLREGYEL